MRIREGNRITWATPLGQSVTMEVKEVRGYVKSPMYGKTVEIRTANGFKSIALDWITHINSKRVRRRR